MEFWRHAADSHHIWGARRGVVRSRPTLERVAPTRPCVMLSIWAREVLRRWDYLGRVGFRSATYREGHTHVDPENPVLGRLVVHVVVDVCEPESVEG